MKTKLLTVIAMSALLLTGCAGQAEATPKPTVSATPEDAFATELREQVPDYDRATDQQWLEVGQAVCKAYDAGATPNQVVDSMQGQNVTADEAAALVVIAAETLCPEYA